MDNLVLQALGFTDPEERVRIQKELYEAVAYLVRTRLEKARSVEEKESRKRLNPRAIAEELSNEFDRSLLRNFPQDFLPAGVATEVLEIPEGEAEVGVDLFTADTIRIGSQVLRLGSLPKAKFVKLVIDNGRRHRVELPQQEEVCAAVVVEYEAYRSHMVAVLQELARSRTPSDKVAAKIAQELERLIFIRHQ